MGRLLQLVALYKLSLGACGRSFVARTHRPSVHSSPFSQSVSARHECRVFTAGSSEGMLPFGLAAGTSGALAHADAATTNKNGSAKRIRVVLMLERRCKLHARARSEQLEHGAPRITNGSAHRPIARHRRFETRRAPLA
jgi:hypothetical protein